MWKSLKNIGAALVDLAAIAGKEVAFQSAKANKKTSSITGNMAAKAHELRENYEVSLASRKDGVDGELVIVKRNEA